MSIMLRHLKNRSVKFRFKTDRKIVRIFFYFFLKSFYANYIYMWILLRTFTTTKSQRKTGKNASVHDKIDRKPLSDYKLNCFRWAPIKPKARAQLYQRAHSKCEIRWWICIDVKWSLNVFDSRNVRDFNIRK